MEFSEGCDQLILPSVLEEIGVQLSPSLARWVGCTTVWGVVLLLFQRDLSFSSPGSREEVMDPYRAFPRAGRSFQPIPTGLRRLPRRVIIIS